MMTADQNKAIDYAAPQEIRALQLELLQRHVRHLRQNSPFYRAMFERINFEPDQLTDLTLLATLPLTDKADLCTHNRDFLAVSEEQVVDICQTSGTTGEPATIWQSEKDLQRLACNEQRAFIAAGITATDRVLVGAALDRVFMAGLAYFLGLRNIGATAIRAGSGQPALVAELIRRQRPNVLIGVPSLLLGVAQQLERLGLNPAQAGVEKLICIGEPVRSENLHLSALGTALQQSWDAEIYATYASTELATAFADCPAGAGGHLLPELVVIEIVDNDGQPVAAGQSGEVVVTPLGIEATPLLRYRTGDIARLHDQQCRCGRQTPRLGPIIGRRAQMLKCRGTTLFPAAISRALEEISAVRGHYIEVYQEYDLSDRIRVVVGCSDPELCRADIASRIAASTRVKPEVVLVSPEKIVSQTIRPDQRKPITFFDYRQGDFEQEE
jgi:phenylacetate-CoA ligase